MMRRSDTLDKTDVIDMGRKAQRSRGQAVLETGQIDAHFH